MSIEKEEVRNGIIEILKEIKEDIDITITNETELMHDLEMDSVNIIDMIVELENKFSISFDDMEDLINNIGSVGSLTQYVFDVLNAVSES